MGTIKNIIYNCRHATYLIEKRQHGSLTIRERIELLIHLAGCGVCRLFQRQSRWINHLIRGRSHSPEEQKSRLDDEFKRQLQEKIDDHLKKG